MILAQGQYTIRRLPLGGNLLKWQEEWSLGNGIISGWSNNGNADENSRVMGSNPFGINSMLWKCVPDATVADNGGSAGGYNTSTKVLDKNFAYRYCVFVYKNKTGGTTYHGCQGVNNLDGTSNGNPYFWSGNITPGQWYLMVGVIQPNSITAQSGISGVYDMTGKKIASGTDFKFRTDGTNASFRSYLYYSYDTTVNQWFYNPMLYKLDGTEPSIEQILQVSIRNEVDTVKTDYSLRFDVLNESISAKATKTEVNDLASKVSAAEQKITPEAIINTVSSSTATSGGRNLLRNSDFKNGFSNWAFSGNLTIDNSVTILGVNPIKYTGSSSAIGYVNLYQQIASLLKPSTKYTLSCYAKYSGNQIANTFGLYVEGNVYSYPTLPTGTSDWKKHTVIFTTPSTLTDVRVGWYFAPNVANNCMTWLTMFQLEEGTSATDWKQSPDDIADKTWVGQNYSTITQTADKIALEIGKVQLGGRNLIPNSSNIYNISQKQLEGTYTHNVSDKDGGNFATQIAFDRAGGLFRIGQANTDSILKISGNTYTYSIWIYPIVGSQVALWISAIEGPVINLVAGKWQRISFTATMAEGIWHDAWRFVDIRAINAGDIFKLYHPQVEVGNKLSDWSLNPDDTPTKDNILASINLSQEDIKIKAEKIALEGTVTANNNFKIRLDGVAEMKGAIVEGIINAIDGVFKGALSTPFIEYTYANGDTVDLSKNSNISIESYVTDPITLRLSTDIKNNGREIAIFNKGITSNNAAITIITDVYNTTASIAKNTLAIFRAVPQYGSLKWVRVF